MMHDKEKFLEKLPLQVRALRSELQEANRATIRAFNTVHSLIQRMLDEGMIPARDRSITDAFNALARCISEAEEVSNQFGSAVWYADMERQRRENGGSIRLLDPTDIANITALVEQDIAVELKS